MGWDRPDRGRARQRRRLLRLASEPGGGLAWSCSSGSPPSVRRCSRRCVPVAPRRHALRPARSRRARIGALRRALAQARSCWRIGLVLALAGTPCGRLGRRPGDRRHRGRPGAGQRAVRPDRPQELLRDHAQGRPAARGGRAPRPVAGPYRVHRMPIWDPIGWKIEPSPRPGPRLRRLGARHDPAEVRPPLRRSSTR